MVPLNRGAAGLGDCRFMLLVPVGMARDGTSEEELLPSAHHIYIMKEHSFGGPDSQHSTCAAPALVMGCVVGSLESTRV